MRKTIASKIINAMLDDGYTYHGKTSGQLSFRGNSNLSHYLDWKGLKSESVIVRSAARAGKFYNDGWELLVFSKK